MAEAARNDERILASARAVFVANPAAPIAAVAEHAGVGISALYRRYPSKEELLRRLCWDGLSIFVATVEEALERVRAGDGDPWDAYRACLRRLVEAETSALTLSLAGTFTPTAELFALAEHAQAVSTELFGRVKDAGAIRPDVVVDDIGLLLEQVAAVKVPDPARTAALRRRYLELALQAVHTPGEPLPEPAPTWQDLNERWVR